MEELDDTALMLRYRDGDMRAFECLYQRHKTILYRYLQRMCKQPEMANDVFQEVWSKVIAQRDRYEVRAQFKTFLYTIARNAALDMFRRHRAEHINDWTDIDDQANQLQDGSLSPETEAVTTQLKQDLKLELQKLPAAQREAFLLFEEAELDLHEIAAITDTSMETVKSRLRYAVNKLRAALHHHRPDHHPGHALTSGGTS
ncbi:MAG TPA: RNA polymerase sigma factor [Steroidobacteraceae bacterium]|nr:RNA polymerase sigma factor [Steroidobacteraceae bacterium]